MFRTPGVILIDPKYPHNVGATIRACSCFGAQSLAWTGSRIDVSKYWRPPREERMKGYKSAKFLNHPRPLEPFHDATPVCVEVHENSEPLTLFEHPENIMSSGQKTAAFRRLSGGIAIGSSTFRLTSA